MVDYFLGFYPFLRTFLKRPWTSPGSWRLLAYSMSIGGKTMSNQRYAPEFKDEAVHQVLERGYSVSEVSERLGVSAHSLHKWVRAAKPDKSDELDAELKETKREILRLRADLRRAEEDRDILKKAARYFASQPE